MDETMLFFYTIGIVNICYSKQTRLNLPVLELHILKDSESTQIIPVILFFPEARKVSVSM